MIKILNDSGIIGILVYFDFKTIEKWSSGEYENKFNEK